MLQPRECAQKHARIQNDECHGRSSLGLSDFKDGLLFSRSGQFDKRTHAPGFGQNFSLFCIGRGCGVFDAHLSQLNASFSTSCKFSLSLTSSHLTVFFQFSTNSGLNLTR